MKRLSVWTVYLWSYSIYGSCSLRVTVSTPFPVQLLIRPVIRCLSFRLVSDAKHCVRLVLSYSKYHSVSSAFSSEGSLWFRKTTENSVCFLKSFLRLCPACDSHSHVDSLVFFHLLLIGPVLSRFNAHFELAKWQKSSFFTKAEIET